MAVYQSDANELSPIEGSLCTKCTRLISRTILPLDYEDFGIDQEAITLQDGTEAPIVHNVCIELNMDLDHLVLNCNKFKRVKKDIIKDVFDINP